MKNYLKLFISGGLTSFIFPPFFLIPIRFITVPYFFYITTKLKIWELYPSGTEGHRTAEVSLGGVDTSKLSSRTMEANDIPGLYFIGEAVDVTGPLGGYNFQWAWASGFAAGQYV